MRQFLEDQRGIEPGERRAADVLLHVDAAEAERRRLAQRLDRKGFVLVPVARMRHQRVAGELPSGRLEGVLLLGEVEIHIIFCQPGSEPGVYEACQRLKSPIMDCRVKPGNDVVVMRVAGGPRTG